MFAVHPQTLAGATARALTHSVPLLVEVLQSKERAVIGSCVLGRAQTQGAAHGAAVGAPNGPTDAGLASWLDACPMEVTDEARAGILAMVKAVGKRNGIEH